jgi:hypothetical protein
LQNCYKREIPHTDGKPIKAQLSDPRGEWL